MVDFQVIGTELALRWDDGEEAFIPLDLLRRHCPCAGCKGETDIMGNIFRGDKSPLTEDSFRLTAITPVGGYALRPAWADGHSTGLYSYEYLRALGRTVGGQG